MYNTTNNKIQALHDIWTFAELINYEGGVKNFAKIHKKLAGFVTAPQVAKVCLLHKGFGKEHYNRRRLVLMPRGHLKSTVCSVLYALWRIYRNPYIRILVGCNLKDLSKTFIRALRQYLEDPELQERVWNNRPHFEGRLVPLMDSAGRKRRDKNREEDDPEQTEAADKKVIWTLEAIQVIRDKVIKEPTLLATSVGSRITGQHYDLLILDDIVDFDNCKTPAKIASVFGWAQDMESVVDPPRQVKVGGKNGIWVEETVGDEILALGTRYDKLDYWGYIMENMEDLDYKVFVRNIHRNGANYVNPKWAREPAVQGKRKKDIHQLKTGSPEGGYIWAEKFTAGYVKRLKASTKISRRWNSQYLNSIVDAEDMILKPEKIKYFTIRGVKKVDNGCLEITLPDDQGKRVIKPFLCVDPAGSLETTADNSALSVGGMDAEHNLYIVDTKVGKYTIMEIVKHIFELCEKWGLYAVTVETNGVGVSIPYAIKEQFSKDRKPIVVNELRSKGEKKERLESGLQPLIENGKLWLADWMAVNSIVQDEILYFPRETAKDDWLDTVDMIRAKAFPTPTSMKNKSKFRQKTKFVNRKWGGTR